MAQQPNRLTITLDEDTIALLERLKKLTGMSPAQTVQKLIPSHLEELWVYLTWMEGLPEGPSKLRSLGTYLIQSYGPSTLIEDIKKIDPTFVTPNERVMIESSISDTEQS